LQTKIDILIVLPRKNGKAKNYFCLLFVYKRSFTIPRLAEIHAAVI